MQFHDAETLVWKVQLQLDDTRLRSPGTPQARCDFYRETIRMEGTVIVLVACIAIGFAIVAGSNIPEIRYTLMDRHILAPQTSF